MPDEISLSVLERGRTGPFLMSRKNRVFRASALGKEYIVKVYRGEWGERASVEYRVLSECRRKGVPVPSPVALLERAIVMEPVKGELASDSFDREMSGRSPRLTEDAKTLAKSLAEWLSRFHEAFDFELVRGDAILRNFIVSNEGVVGLDFEESSRGDTLCDLGQLCASAAMMDPPFTEDKVAFARHLASCYWARSGVDRSDELDPHISAAVRHYAPYRSNGNELMAYASLIDGGNITFVPSHDLE